MYFHLIPASAITSHGFAVIFNFIITTDVVYVPKMEIPSMRAPLLEKRTPPFPMTNTTLKGLVSQTQVSAKVCETWCDRVIAP